MFGTAFTGTLKSWSSEHDNWAAGVSFHLFSIDGLGKVEIIQAEDGKRLGIRAAILCGVAARCSFRSNNKDPAFSVWGSSSKSIPNALRSEEWLLWLRSEKVIGLPEIHAGA